MGETQGLTERQKKWFASVQEGLARDTGKTIEEWTAIARTCQETGHRARQAWLKAHHGLGVNRASYVLSVAFPQDGGWEDAEGLRKALWADAGSAAILAAVEAAMAELEGVVVGQRKGFTAFSRKVQFAALKPLKDGKASLGLALPAEADARLEPPRNESWSERLTSRLLLEAPAQVDASVASLLKRAWERS